MPRKNRLVFKIDHAYVHMKDMISEFFFKLGCLVGSKPVLFSVVPLLVSCGFGFGFFTMKVNDKTEELFTPTDSQIFTDRRRMKELFPDSTSWNFDAFGLNDIPRLAVLLFRHGGKDESTSDKLIPANIHTDHDKYDIFDPSVISQIRYIVDTVMAIKVESNGKSYAMEDICARFLNSCVIDGQHYTSNQFVQDVTAGNVSYPLFWHPLGPRDLSLNIVGVSTTSEGKLKSARVLKIRWFWRVDRQTEATLWNVEFMEVVRKLEKNLSIDLDLAYSTSESLESELLKGTTGDAIYFIMTIMLMVFYSVLVSAGGDMVSTRTLLACGGVLAAIMGIVTAMGFLFLIGVEYVNFVGIMPYLVLGIGVDDMFLLMSAWGESIQYIVDVPQRVGLTFSAAGIGITITTLTDFLAFLIGASSNFIAVRQFCIFTAVAVLLCYVYHCTLFGACMSLHGDRVYGAKHCLTCQKAKTRDELRAEGAGNCKVYCCGGSVPIRNYEDESICESLPRFLLPKLILNPVIKVILLLAFLGYLAAAIYGAIQLKPGMKYVDLVLRSSYYYKYSSWEEEYFGERLAIAFVVDQDINYADKDGDSFRKLLNEVQRDPIINSTFLRCWLHRYSRSHFYPSTQSEALNKTLFNQGLKEYLKWDLHSQNDVHFSQNSTRIIATRCYLLTINEVSIFVQSELMIRLRETVKKSDVKMFVFQPVFVMLEHTIAILPSTLQTVGTAVTMMFLVTLMMLPQLLMVSLVTLNIVFIITCVFGFMHFLGISFSGISMIHILMSVGFSVDFSAHICAAYLMSNLPLRVDRARYALVHASGPIFNGGMSSLVGVSMLLMSESYFFRSFFKIMSMVITAGAINSVFFMPIILSYIGPENPPEKSDSRRLSTFASVIDGIGSPAGMSLFKRRRSSPPIHPMARPGYSTEVGMTKSVHSTEVGMAKSVHSTEVGMAASTEPSTSLPLTQKESLAAVKSKSKEMLAKAVSAVSFKLPPGHEEVVQSPPPIQPPPPGEEQAAGSQGSVQASTGERLVIESETPSSSVDPDESIKELEEKEGRASDTTQNANVEDKDITFNNSP